MRIRPLLALTLALAQGLGIGTAWANPTDAAVVAGSANIDRQGNILRIINTPGTIINWGSFTIGPDEITRFIQQNGSSAVLNRITGQNPSLILGALESNGRVFLVNPNGVVFGAGSRVDVNGLVASSLNITNEDFRNGRLRFDAAGANPGSIRNDGAITTPAGGRVYLIAPNVENNGLISSPQGEVVLAAGRQVELVDSQNPDLRVVVSAPGDRAVNVGRIISAGGSVGIYGALINQRGVVDADSAVVGENGRIVFRASDTTLLEAGSVTTARGVDTGGTVHVLGDHVGLTGDATIDASGRDAGGTVLVGGDYHGGNAAIANASATYAGAGTTIRADATQSGNGGRVILWSNGATRAYGNISARGAAVSGNGGFAEVSGATYLDYRGRTDLRAPGGAAGTLLLDPNDVTIQSGPTPATDMAFLDTRSFSGGPASSILTVEDLQAQLALGNVTVSTTSGPPGPLGGHITVANAIGWTNGNMLSLDSDNGIAINGSITAQQDGRLMLTSRGGPITQTAPIGTTYLVINSLGDVLLNGANNMVSVLAAQVGDGSHLNRNFSFLNAQSFMVSTLNGVSGISIATSGGYSSAAPDGVISLRTLSGDITQLGGALLVGKAVNLEADNVILNELNGAGVISGSATTFSYRSIGDVIVDTVAGRTGIQGGGNVSLVSEQGNIALNAPVFVTDGSVNLAAALGSIGGNGVAQGLTVSATAGNGIDLHTQTGAISASNAGGTGGISINNIGALTVNNVTDQGTGVVSIQTSGALTVNGPVSSAGGGAIALSANPTGAATDVLTINGSVAPTPGTGVAVSTSGPILLRAGDAINVTGAITGNVTQQPNLNAPPPPTLAQCIANPALTGCSAVLPTLTQCTATPTLAGCSVVLPTLAQCTATPTLAGCSVVLPTLTQCTATPTLAGCSVVLPTITQCTATPTLAGCSVVLPTLSQCIATPTLAGCSVVLPTPAQCAAQPTLAGCGSVLPTLAQCTTTPTLTGCSVVLPTITQCTATPTLAGCSVVLPTLVQCTATPTLTGCSAVLPTLTQCTTTPTLTGCSVVLPTLSQCAATPTLAGCSVVLPTLTQCTVTPTLAGCSVVLPTITQCTTTPTLTGCSVVLPTLAQCTATPTLAGCSTVLPTPAQCTITPTLAGCSSVLPTTAQCLAQPTLAGCGAVLPTVSQCVLNPAMAGCSTVLPSVTQCTATPTLAGCSVVLPTLAQCTATPTLSGCFVVLPTIVQCTTNPGLPGCTTVLPSLTQCTTSPNLAGCSAVLPTLTQCTTSPNLAGCSAVLPTLTQCTTSPNLAGCSTVLPSLATCVATPTAVGCSAVLPTLAQCVTSPGTPGCTVVLPSLAQCVGLPSRTGCNVVLPTLTQCMSTPSLAGCSVVLPTLAQCVAAPALSGCTVVLPPVATCASTPTLPGCSVILPSTQTQTSSNAPVIQVVNNTINLINTTSSHTTPDPPLPSGSTDSTGKKDDGKKDDPKGSVTTDKPGAKNEDAAKKTYCN